MIRLDFARTVARPLQALRWGLLAAGLLAATSMFLWSDTLQGQLEALEWKQNAQPAAASRSSGALRAESTASRPTPQLRDVERELGVNWRGVFAAIEKSVTPEIRVMAIRPDPQRQSLLIQAKAANGEQAQRFVERLQAGGIIRDAHLVHEAREDDDELLAFSVRARWEVTR